MPGYFIHTAHGIETLNCLESFLEENGLSGKFKRRYKAAGRVVLCDKKGKCPDSGSNWYKLFLTGLVLPDAGKFSADPDIKKSDSDSHFAGYEDDKKTPALKSFISAHRLSFDDPLTLGYAMHLFLDKKYVQLSENNIAIPEGSGITNKELVQKYNINLNSFLKATDECFVTMVAGQEYWYTELLKDIAVKLNSSDDDTDKEKIEVFISSAAGEFCRDYLIPLLDNDMAKGKYSLTKWSAEKIKIKYYRSKWEEIIGDNEKYKNDKLFFEGVIQELDDVTGSARGHKEKDHNLFLVVCIIPVVTAIFSAVSGALNGYGDTLWSVICNCIATVLSVVLVAFNTYIEKTNDKEAWLRQRLYYSMLILEMEKFCEGIEEYDLQKNEEKIKLFKERICKLRTKDYENFFTNMGCSYFDKQ